MKRIVKWFYILSFSPASKTSADDIALKKLHCKDREEKSHILNGKNFVELIYTYYIFKLFYLYRVSHKLTLDLLENLAGGKVKRNFAFLYGPF